MKILTKDNLVIILLLFIIGIMVFFKKQTPVYETKTVIKTDTSITKIIGQLQSDFSKFKIQEPKIVYVKSVNERIIEKVPQQVLDTLSRAEKKRLVKLNEYKDTLINKDISIFSKILTDGHIFDNKIKYEFNQKTLTNTIIKTKVVNKRGIYLFGEVGGKQEVFKIGIGTSYINKKDWFFFYKADIIYMPGFENKIIHNLGIGKKIF